jgi:hypothetical protein
MHGVQNQGVNVEMWHMNLLLSAEDIPVILKLILK